MKTHDDEETLLRSVALKNAQSILQTRNRVECELVKANAALEKKSSELAHSLQQKKCSEEALRDESRILELLNKTGTALTAQLDLHSLMQAVTDAGTQLSGAQWGAFFYNSHHAGEQSTQQLYTATAATAAPFASALQAGDTPRRYLIAMR